jgi:hypothetical protein
MERKPEGWTTEEESRSGERGGGRHGWSCSIIEAKEADAGMGQLSD